MMEALQIDTALNVYGYTRISRDEDGDRESIENQRKVIEQYCETNGMCLKEVISDNNMSGYDFAGRFGLNRIRRLVEKKELDVLIIKDLSRLGRNQAHFLLFVDFLKENGVRLISTSDSFDTDDKSNEVLVGIKAWYNELYLKDISKKTKDNIRAIQKERGIVTVPSYGYIKCKEQDGHTYYILDQEAAAVVREMFDLYFDGMGVKSIAKLFTEKGYMTPKDRRYVSNGIPAKNLGDNTGRWSPQSVRRMLINEAYYGVLVNNRTQRTSINKKPVGYNVPEEEWIRHEGFFPAIISKEEHIKAKQLLSDRRRRNYRKGPKGPHLYTGYLKCGKCGKNLVFKPIYSKAKVVTSNSYTCSTYNKYGASFCYAHAVREETVTEVLVDELKRMQKNAVINHEKMDEEVKRRRKDSALYKKTLGGLADKKIRLESKIERILEEKFEGRISDKIANRMIDKANQEITIVEEQIEAVKAEEHENNQMSEDLERSAEILDMVLERGTINRKLLEVLVDEIRIYQEEVGGKGKKVKKDIEIIWRPAFRVHDDDPGLVVVADISISNKVTYTSGG